MSDAPTPLFSIHNAGQPSGGYQAFHLAQQSFPVWGVVLAVAVTTLAVLGIALMRRSQRA
jgi:hypothetical protein